MAEPVHAKVRRCLHASEGLYHRLVLLVGETGSGKSLVLRDVAEELGVDVINVNLTVASRLLELTAKQRVLRLPGILEELVDRGKPSVLLDNLEILFDKELKQDPLRLLQGISRNHSVVASWGGTVDKGKLVYAETGHPEYRRYDLIDTLVVSMDGWSSVDTPVKNK